MLYWQKAVVFMLNPKKYTTHAGHNSIVVWLLGPSSCSSPSTKELHVHFIGEWWCTFLLFSLFLTFFSLATVSLSLFPSLSTTHTDTYTRRVASRRVTSRRVTSRHLYQLWPQMHFRFSSIFLKWPKKKKVLRTLSRGKNVPTIWNKNAIYGDRPNRFGKTSFTTIGITDMMQIRLLKQGALW